MAAVNSLVPVLGTMMVLRRPCASSVMRRNLPAIVLAEFHIEVLPLDLDLLRFDNIIHSGAKCGRTRAVGEAKILPNFNPPKG